MSNEDAEGVQDVRGEALWLAESQHAWGQGDESRAAVPDLLPDHAADWDLRQLRLRSPRSWMPLDFVGGADSRDRYGRPCLP